MTNAIKKTEYAVVSSAEIFADNTCVHVTLMLELGDGRQQVGPHVLTEDLLRGILAAAGMRKWSEFVGKPIRIRTREDGRVQEVGHFLRNDSWYQIV